MRVGCPCQWAAASQPPRSAGTSPRPGARMASRISGSSVFGEGVARRREVVRPVEAEAHGPVSRSARPALRLPSRAGRRRRTASRWRGRHRAGSSGRRARRISRLRATSRWTGRRPASGRRRPGAGRGLRGRAVPGRSGAGRPGCRAGRRSARRPRPGAGCPTTGCCAAPSGSAPRFSRPRGRSSVRAGRRGWRGRAGFQFRAFFAGDRSIVRNARPPAAVRAPGRRGNGGRRRLGVPVELAGAFGIGFEAVLGAGVVGEEDGGVL
jgi:hypothetical protein